MFELAVTFCVDAPTERAWRWLADLEAIALWSAPVLRASCPGNRTGVGAERVCELRGGVVLRERWLQWDEGRSFTYEGVGIPLIRRATNRWTVMPIGEQSRVTSTATIELKGGFLGRIFEPVFLRFARRTAAQSLAPLKFLIENDRPGDAARDLIPVAVGPC